ncbi:hypothetical protein ACIRO3_23280 [Streptomyces sp. NPDC102278]|uniref:hypothetical protein n=1 Tax=Streptomyces sp. NPDC102278 TaxID=3366152 RepID=UPI00381A5B13
MPYLIPARTPLAPEEVDRTFDHLLALQMGGGIYASDRTPNTPELAFLLLRLAENIVFPTTGATRSRTRTPSPWTRSGASCCPPCPTTAVPGIARSIIRFVENVIPTLTTTETPAPPWRPGATSTWHGLYRPWAAEPFWPRLALRAEGAAW